MVNLYRVSELMHQELDRRFEEFVKSLDKMDESADDTPHETKRKLYEQVAALPAEMLGPAMQQYVQQFGQAEWDHQVVLHHARTVKEAQGG